MIDNVIKRWDKNNVLFPFITEEKFNANLVKIKNWQANKEKTLENIIQNGAKLIELRIENIKRFSKSYIDFFNAGDVIELRYSRVSGSGTLISFHAPMFTAKAIY